MQKRFSFVFATLAVSAVAFAPLAVSAVAQNPITADSPYQVGYAANLNVGTSVVNYPTPALSPASSPRSAPVTSASTSIPLIRLKKKSPAAPAWSPRTD